MGPPDMRDDMQMNLDRAAFLPSTRIRYKIEQQNNGVVERDGRI